MKTEIEMVKDFQKVFGHPVADSPKYLSTDRCLMRHNILSEEVGELLGAMVNKNLTEVADAIADCIYILYGTAIEFGISDKMEAVFHEVHRSNMSKLGEDGKPIYREDGKVVKGPNYTKPDIASIIYPK
jgi:predicted HAD superfamily Cof-like phosphohydrolase